MSKGAGYRVYLTVVFCIIGVCLQILYLWIYPTGDTNRHLQYALILLCLYYVMRTHGTGPDGLLSLWAIACTAGADFFLVALRQEQRLPGMAVFVLAQALWAIRLLRMESGRRALLHGISWLLMAGALAVVSVIIARGVDAVLLLTAVYGAFLLTTTVFAWVGRENLLFTLGMSLFVCCDIFVAANCAGSYMDTGALPLVEQMNGIPFNMMWAFYGPSQMLLALSARDGGERKT